VQKHVAEDKKEPVTEKKESVAVVNAPVV